MLQNCQVSYALLKFSIFLTSGAF